MGTDAHLQLFARALCAQHYRRYSNVSDVIYLTIQQSLDASGCFSIPQSVCAKLSMALAVVGIRCDSQCSLRSFNASPPILRNVVTQLVSIAGHRGGENVTHLMSFSLLERSSCGRGELLLGLKSCIMCRLLSSPLHLKPA